MGMATFLLPSNTSLFFHSKPPHSSLPTPVAFSPLRFPRLPEKSLPSFSRCRIIQNSALRLPLESAEDESTTFAIASLRIAASSAVLFLAFSLGGFIFGVRCCSASSLSCPSSSAVDSCTLTGEEQQVEGDDVKIGIAENSEEKEFDAAFQAWKSKSFALTVPLKIVALRGSIPPSWIKDFMQSQGKRLKLNVKLNGSLDGIFSELSIPHGTSKVGPSSVVAADAVSIGDSWLNIAIKKALIEPLQDVEDQEWFKCLSAKWKILLCRNSEGEIDPEGKIWAAPYRWGCMVIAYKKSAFQDKNLAPIEDWGDLWRPELRGRISMVDSPREVIGAVLKYMGASYNTKNINLHVDGGRDAVLQNLTSLVKQVRLFDSVHYLKAFGVGDVWVAVGWSSDVLPVVQRMSNVAVVVPKSGSSLWADLWAIPATARVESDKVGGRVRGPSPLIHQWIEFCLQTSRALPFKQEVVPGASPASLESPLVESTIDLAKGKPQLDTNLINGVPPQAILEMCEFLEPLSDSTLADYRWLISSIGKSDNKLSVKIHYSISSFVQMVSGKFTAKKMV